MLFQLLIRYTKELHLSSIFTQSLLNDIKTIFM